MSYDQKSFDLAAYFLPPHSTVVVKDALAQEIQNVVEDFLRDLEAKTQQAWNE
jgi:polysaccharide pyruvyl transferase WcaK-like protein